MASFEEQYLDVLQNIEMAIVSVYREHHDLLDYEVDKVLNLIWTEYRNEKAGKATPMPKLSENAQRVYDRVKEICEWRIGRKDILEDKFTDMKPRPISLDEIMACLKRILKSVKLWNKEGGRQGYLYFIDHHID
ncbi:MAG TPA: hypothetical protein VNK49_11515 [Anaerolineales bacterium]|nr:hypothetical protein [Anaerolineales bacterium]